MKYVLTNGHTYIGKKSNGKFVATYEAGIAIAFGSETKAWNALSQLPSIYKEEGYTPKPLEAKEKTKAEKELLLEKARVTSETEVKKGVRYQSEDSEWLAEFKRNLIIVDETLGNLKALYAKLYSDLTIASDEIEDLEHAMEFIKPNAAMAWKLEDDMRKARKRRRECKDGMMLAETAMKFNLDDWGTGKMKETLRQLEHRHYVPKVRKDLFK